jgi:hypothetical protein
MIKGQNVPLKDKAIIKKRLAKGASYSEAIKGTSVKSKSTVKKIKEEGSNEIEQIRERYLALIESFGAGEIDRAKLWVGMAHATKPFSSHTEPDREIPDWMNREKALKYIDSLAGIPKEKEAPSQQITAQEVNIFNINREKAKKLGDDFKKFLKGHVHGGK